MTRKFILSSAFIWGWPSASKSPWKPTGKKLVILLQKLISATCVVWDCGIVTPTGGVLYAYIKRCFRFEELRPLKQNLYRKLLFEKAVTGRSSLVICLPQATEIASTWTEVHPDSTTGLGTLMFTHGQCYMTARAQWLKISVTVISALFTGNLIKISLSWWLEYARAVWQNSFPYYMALQR